MSDSTVTMPASDSNSVSTLELFFDLVFVFTISQVALVLEHHPDWSTVAQGLLELLVIFWMYGGFAWLTNTIGSKTPRQRTVLLLGMAAFLVVSLAVPRAFGTDGVAFGWAYLVLNVVHLVGFLIGGVAGAAQSMRRIGSINLVAAALVLAAGYLGAPWHWLLWPLAVLAQWGTALLRVGDTDFAIRTEHFAERHGLMAIIVLGESLISVAVAAHNLPVDWKLIVEVLCGLAASGAMWWCYFARDDEAAAAAFAKHDSRGLRAMALLAWDLPHVFMLAGVVAVAAGSRLSLEDLLGPATTAAAVLTAGGVAVYLLALAAWRALLRFATPLPRSFGGLITLATIPIGTRFGVAQELLTTAVVIVGVLLFERSRQTRGESRTVHPAG